MRLLEVANNVAASWKLITEQGSTKDLLGWTRWRKGTWKSQVCRVMFKEACGWLDDGVVVLCVQEMDQVVLWLICSRMRNKISTHPPSGSEKELPSSSLSPPRIDLRSGTRDVVRALVLSSKFYFIRWKHHHRHGQQHFIKSCPATA